MKKVSLDSNIAILIARNERFESFFYERYPPSENEFILCFAADVEPHSLGFRLGWGNRKTTMLEDFIATTTQINEVSSKIKKAYIEIEAYSLFPPSRNPKAKPLTAWGKMTSG